VQAKDSARYYRVTVERVQNESDDESDVRWDSTVRRIWKMYVLNRRVTELRRRGLGRSRAAQVLLSRVAALRIELRIDVPGENGATRDVVLAGWNGL